MIYIGLEIGLDVLVFKCVGTLLHLVYAYKCCDDEGGPGNKIPLQGVPGPKKFENPWPKSFESNARLNN